LFGCFVGRRQGEKSRCGFKKKRGWLKEKVGKDKTKNSQKGVTWGRSGTVSNCQIAGGSKKKKKKKQSIGYMLSWDEAPAFLPAEGRAGNRGIDRLWGEKKKAIAGGEDWVLKKEATSPRTLD